MLVVGGFGWNRKCMRLKKKFNEKNFFKEKISPYFKKRIDQSKGNRRGLEKQVFYDELESLNRQDYTSQPVKDEQFALSPGVIQKYKNRILLIFSSNCPTHCRYCFRREYPYQRSHYTHEMADKIIALCRRDESLSEIILSGGEPLMRPNREFASFIDLTNSIKTIKRIRFHSRMLSFAPNRLRTWTPLWKRSVKQLIFVTHFNHSQELDIEIIPLIKKLKKEGFTLLNQAVLLKDINDSPRELINLHETLHEYGILPYYLHQLDKVRGASHFAVSQAKGKALMKKITKELPGYLVPKYVKEIPGEVSKTLIR